MSQTVTLVPWRPGEAFRDRNWRAIEPHVHSLGYPVFTGDSVGEWARSGACNDAARRAGDWEVALVTDADTYLEQDAVRRAVAHVRRTRGAARPHDRRYMLSLAASKVAVLKGPQAVPARHLGSIAPGGGALVIHRQAWEAVGGYPMEFVGWGHEDTYIGIELVVRSSWTRLPGLAWHLFHPAASMRTPTAQANRARMDARYAEPEVQRAMRRLSRKLGYDVRSVL